MLSNHVFTQRLIGAWRVSTEPQLPVLREVKLRFRVDKISEGSHHRE